MAIGCNISLLFTTFYLLFSSPSHPPLLTNYKILDNCTHRFRPKVQNHKKPTAGGSGTKHPPKTCKKATTLYIIFFFLFILLFQSTPVQIKRKNRAFELFTIFEKQTFKNQFFRCARFSHDFVRFVLLSSKMEKERKIKIKTKLYALLNSVNALINIILSEHEIKKVQKHDFYRHFRTGGCRILPHSI